MALVDRDRLYVAVNDAALELFQCERDEVIGTLAGRTAVDDDPAQSDHEWERLLETGELYAQRVVENSNGDLVHVSYAAHATTVGGRWLTLIVTVSAHVEPDGRELIGTAPSQAPVGSASSRASVLTKREREVVRRVALGAGTRKIAADMYLSPATVRSHVRNAMVKTGAHTRAQLVAIVLGDNLGDE